MGLHYLNQLFEPSSIAVFGASERESAQGTLVLKNILAAGFEGKIYPVNPKYETLQGLACQADLSAIGHTIDLAIIATPAKTVSSILHQCGEHGVKGAIILSAGFAETGVRGKKLEKDAIDLARQYDMHIVGPNCLGIMRPPTKLNATVGYNQAKLGRMALVSQSDAVCTSILDWAEARQVGFSAVVTLGDAADVSFGDVLDYLAMDIKTDSILLYVEAVKDARSFMSGLRTASRMKPVIVLKAGRYEEGSRAASSHTGAIVGGDDAFDAALERAGVVRVNSVGQLFSAAEILSSGIAVNQNRLMILTNGGGLGIMATDKAIAAGLRVPKPSTKALAAMNKVLPATWSKNNPADILGDATPERYEAVLKICLEDEGVDGVLVMLTPQPFSNPAGVAEAVARVVKDFNKPVVACWMGEARVREGRKILSEAGIPHFNTPEAAVDAFSYLTAYRSNQKMLVQVPASVETQASEPDIEGARLIIESVLAEGRRSLSITESRAILSAFRIPSVPTILTRSPAEALVAAESVGYPVVMKISSPDIIHKSDVNGVRLNINSARTVRSIYQELLESARKYKPDARIDGVTVEPMYRGRAARELMVGLVRDPVFGPVISFGTGGTAVEVHRDRAVVLPPLNDYMIKKTICRTRAARMLVEFRNMPEVNFPALRKVLQRVSELASEMPEILEMDINPLMANPDGVVAVDACITVGYPKGGSQRYDHMAIHPYPNDLVKYQQLADGTNILIRPIRPEDAAMEQEFVRNLSKESRYMRFMQSLRELTSDMLVRFTQIDYDREVAFVALAKQDGHEVEIGVCRYAINPDRLSCEFALVIADHWQGRGLGGLLMQVLIDTARRKGLRAIIGEVLAENIGMLKLMQRLGFERQKSSYDEGIVLVTKHLINNVSKT
ncbi:MAG: GNAT family N-acetyltransferase [Proteobacteria bacterium]|nr:MAG: GNAT family N-acetyltransferase [Pseudomonadota bacterium]